MADSSLMNQNTEKKNGPPILEIHCKDAKTLKIGPQFLQPAATRAEGNFYKRLCMEILLKERESWDSLRRNLLGIDSFHTK